MHTVDRLYSPDGVHTVGRQHFQRTIQGLPARKLQGQSTRIHRSWCNSSTSSSLRHLVSSSLVPLYSTALHIPSPRSHPPAFIFPFWLDHKAREDLFPEQRLNPLLVPSIGSAEPFTTGPPGKSLEDSSLCHLLDEPFRTCLITTSWTGLQYLYTLPRCPQPQRRNTHTPTSPAVKACHMGPIPGQMGTEALQKIRDKS